MPSLREFLEELPKTRESRQYFTDIMVRRIGNPGITGRPLFWHTVVKVTYDINDLDFSGIVIGDDTHFAAVDYAQLIMNPTINDDYRAILRQKYKSDEELLERYYINIYHYIGAEDMCKLSGIHKHPYENAIDFSREICHKHELEYIKYILDSAEKDGLHPDSVFPIFAYLNNPKHWSTATAVPGHYGHDHSILFTVDHDIPDFARNDPYLLAMFTKATSDEVLRCVFSKDPGVISHIIPYVMTYRHDITAKIIDYGKTDDCNRQLWVISSPNESFKIKEKSAIIDWCFELSIEDIKASMSMFELEDARRYEETDITGECIVNITDIDKIRALTVESIFDGSRVTDELFYEDSGNNIYYMLNPNGTYYAYVVVDDNLETIHYIRRHRVALKFILNCHRAVKILRKHFYGVIPDDIIDIIIMCYAGKYCL